jgi:signal peptidase I
MLKGVVIALVFFSLGFSLNTSLPAEVRSATTDTVVESVQRIPFDSIKVYPDEVRIEYPGLRYAKVNSDSMAPLLTHDSVVFEKAPESADEINVNDIISFYEPSEGKTVIHMVVEIVEQDGEIFYKTKGVANPDADPWLVPFENVKGIMVGTVR